MDWYMFIIYGILTIGAVSSFLNYRLQHKWYMETKDDRDKADI